MAELAIPLIALGGMYVISKQQEKNENVKEKITFSEFVCQCLIAVRLLKYLRLKREINICKVLSKDLICVKLYGAVNNDLHD